MSNHFIRVYLILIPFSIFYVVNIGFSLPASDENKKWVLTQTLRDTVTFDESSKHISLRGKDLTSFTRKELVYLFGEAVEGVFIYENRSIPTRFNYNMYHNRIEIVVDGDDGTFQLYELPNRIETQDNVFLVDEKGRILEEYETASNFFYIVYESESKIEHLVPSKTISGSAPVSSSFQSLMTSPSGDSQRQVEQPTTNIYFEAKPYLCYYKGKRLVKVTSTKGLLKAIDSRQRNIIETLLRNYPIEFDNVDHLRSILASLKL